MSGHSAWLTVRGNYISPGKWYGESRAQAAVRLDEVARLRALAVSVPRARRSAIVARARRRLVEAHGWLVISGRYGVGVLS